MQHCRCCQTCSGAAGGSPRSSRAEPWIPNHAAASRAHATLVPRPPCPQVCGEGHLVEGDAVVPLRAALLAGAHHIVLDGVFHSMSQLGTFKTPTERPWYGSEAVVDSWLRELA